MCLKSTCVFLSSASQEIPEHQHTPHCWAMEKTIDASKSWSHMAVPRDQTVVSIKERFPFATGVFLHKCIWKYFVQQKSFNAPYFTPGGQRAISRHPLNERDTDETHEPMVDAFLTKGIYTNVSSKPLLIRQSVGSDHFMAVGAGNRSDCFYKAHQKDEKNIFIQAALETGLEDCVQLCDDTPVDIIRFLVSDFNNFHEGNSNTYVQHMTEVPFVEIAFDAHKKRHSFTSRTCPKKGDDTYEKRFFKFISDDDTWKTYWKQWEDFDNCKVCRHYFEELGMWDEWKTMIGKKTMWNSPSLLDSGEFYKCLHEIVVRLWK